MSILDADLLSSLRVLCRATVPGASFHALGLGRTGASDIHDLFVPLPPAPRAILLPIWAKGHVLDGGNSQSPLERDRPAPAAGLYRHARSGLEDRVVRPDGFDVYQHPVLCLGLVAAAQANPPAAFMGPDPPARPDGDRRRDTYGQ